ncbi:MAG TPA: phosphoribosylanthranilate isomerase [Anaerolineales bacterium]
MRVKICGLKTLDEALYAVDAGADYLGFNFYPPSPRYVNPLICAGITAGLLERGCGATLVGVFVNESAEKISAILDDCGLYLAQLSGDEHPHVLALLGDRAFKALRLRNTNDLKRAEQLYPRRQAAPAWLVDAFRAGDFGGTGENADWRLAGDLSQRAAIFLAGGLDPGNVGRAVEQVRPWGVDVASGVESGPGKKDPEKMKAFVQAARKPHL